MGMLTQVIHQLGSPLSHSVCIPGSGDYYCSGNDLGNFMNIPPDGIAAMAEDGGRIL